MLFGQYVFCGHIMSIMLQAGQISGSEAVYGMGESLKEYCIRYDCRELLAQWHPDKNGDLTPDKITSGSQRKVWWRCDQGHEWMGRSYDRAKRGTGCPYCAGKRILPGMDLASLYPHLADQWHPKRNGELGPEDVLPGSHRSVWWKCSRGHEWRAIINSRVNGQGCPVCTGRAVVAGKNDLGTVFPAVAMEWHPERNGLLRPSQVISGSKRKVWWRCDQGHEWQASIKSRTQGVGCPVCAGKIVNPGENDLKSFSPELAEQWNREKNGTLCPEQVSVFSNRRVWWKCSRGHEWQAKISDRATKRSDCPYCTNRKVLAGFNDLKTVEPLVAAQWHPEKNVPLEPNMVLPGSTKRVWWQCSDGHEWKAVIYSRTGAQKCGCPVCAGKTPRVYR